MPDSTDYTRGPTHPNTAGYARYECKGGDDSGSGYMRWRSEEYREHTAGTRRESVGVYEHRLLATLLPEYDDQPLSDVFDDLAGSDVHHTTGCKWLNVIESDRFEAVFGDRHGLEVLDHAEHAAMSTPTRTQLRAFAADAKTDLETSTPDRCARCEAAPDTLVTFEGGDTEFCLSCAQATADGRAIEL